MDVKNVQKLISGSSSLISNYFYLFFYTLFKYIFIKGISQKVADQLDAFLKKINENIIKDDEKKINKTYSKENFENIMNFAHTQNLICSGDIIENVLIMIFSSAMKIDQDETFGKYIFNNFYKLKDSSPRDLNSWFENKFNKISVEELLKIDASIGDIVEKDINKKQEEDPTFNLLVEIFKKKYLNINNEESKSHSKSLLYISNRNVNIMKMNKKIYNALQNYSTTIFDKDITSNSINFLASRMFFTSNFGKIRKVHIKYVKCFITQAFIHYQNTHSPLLKYIEEKEGLSKIPFEYDLGGACVEGRFAYVLLSPLKIESFLSKIKIPHNNLRECGLLELGKVLLFNKNIKSIDINMSLIKSNFLDYLNMSLTLFDNFSVEEINISFNYLKEDSRDYFYNFISKFRGLKRLNLSSNDIKSGAAGLFIALIKLYRTNRSQLELLNLSKCNLEDESLEVLGDLLACKFCKLKHLYMNIEYISNDKKFFRKLSKNRSLETLNINNKSKIGNKSLSYIRRCLSVTNIRTLYLYKNEITELNEIIRTIYRTKIIKNKDEEDSKVDSAILNNLDLSYMDVLLKNPSHIKLISDLIKETGLDCLDLSHILYGINPPSSRNRIPENDINKNYRKVVDELVKELDSSKKNYIYHIKETIKNKVDYKENYEYKDVNLLNKYDDQIIPIIKDKNALFTVFLKEQAKKLINNNGELMAAKERDKALHNKLEKYLVFKRAENNLNHSYQEINNYKLSII